MTHSSLLRSMLNLGLSKSTARRIIEPINSTKSPEEWIPMEKRVINLLQECKTEEEVIRKLDEADL